jgi:hypothetical protein
LPLIALAGAYDLVASPYIAVRGLGEAINDRDSVEIEERVDFPALRENVKEQLNAIGVNDHLKVNNPARWRAHQRVSKLTDSMVESFFTPAGLAARAQGNRPSATGGAMNQGARHSPTRGSPATR